MFNSRTEESGSGFRIEPRPAPIPDNLQQHAYFFSKANTRSFHSGPLVNPIVQSADKRGPPHEMVVHGRRSSEAGRNCEEENKDQMGAHIDATLLGYGSKGNKIHYSGPLIHASGNVDQMLKNHDRQIQEVFRMSLGGKSRAKKLHGDVLHHHHFGYKPGEHSDAPPVYPSSRGTSIPSLFSNRSFGSNHGLAE